MSSGAGLLLHHYDASPFSEKVRLVLGRKGLRWRSVLQPNMMPKPHLLPLTGGYRRIPVLQVGADVYCDSQLIARVVEQRFPEPTLHPYGEGMDHAIAFWADRLLFQAAVPVLFGKIAPAVPAAFIEDRRKLMGGGRDFGAFLAEAPHFAEQLRAHLDFLEAQLRDGRAFLHGPEPCLADFSAYHPVWFLRSVPPAAEALAPFALTRAWADRVKAVGHGAREECPAEEALAVAKAATSTQEEGVEPGEPQGLVPGARVSVVPDDYGFDPVEGELVAASVHEVAVRRSSPEVGEVVVHLPRAGFRVRSA